MPGHVNIAYAAIAVTYSLYVEAAVTRKVAKVRPEFCPNVAKSKMPSLSGSLDKNHVQKGLWSELAYAFSVAGFRPAASSSPVEPRDIARLTCAGRSINLVLRENIGLTVGGHVYSSYSDYVLNQLGYREPPIASFARLSVHRLPGKRIDYDTDLMPGRSD
jgi:hypothetical protein